MAAQERQIHTRSMSTEPGRATDSSSPHRGHPSALDFTMHRVDSSYIFRLLVYAVPWGKMKDKGGKGKMKDKGGKDKGRGQGL